MKPLFERLSGETKTSVQNSFTTEDLKLSVVNEVKRILTTRSHFMDKLPPPAKRTILDFGIPSIVTFGAYDLRRHEELAMEVQQAIASFEPRLTEIQVKMQAPASYCESLYCFVKARLQLADEVEIFQFIVELADEEGEYEYA